MNTMVIPRIKNLVLGFFFTGLIAGYYILLRKLSYVIKCKKIRDVKTNNWQMLEEYIGLHSDASFTHGFCPD